MNVLRAPMLLLLLAAFHASASDSEEGRVAAAKRYLEVAQMSKFGMYMANVIPVIQQEMFRALQSLPRQKP